MSRLIVHPTDFSAASTLAFNEAIRLAKTNGAMLLVLHDRARRAQSSQLGNSR